MVAPFRLFKVQSGENIMRKTGKVKVYKFQPVVDFCLEFTYIFVKIISED